MNRVARARAKRTRDSVPESTAGPWAWENWRAHIAGLPPWDALEIACYTDARVAADTVVLGPYAIIGVRNDNGFATHLNGRSHLGLVIRIDLHRPTDDPDSYLDTDWDQAERSV